MPTDPEITIVLPSYNEEENLAPIIQEFCQVLDPTGRPYEILVVDDGSTDGTAARLSALAQTIPTLRFQRHTTNFGQSAAILTGYCKARGEIVVTMDADMQNDPADLPEMLRRLEACDMVTGIRQNRRDTLTKRLSSRVANAVRGALLGDGIHDAGCTFRAVRRRCLGQLPPFRGLHRFLPTILKIHGYRVEEMPVNHRPRVRGVSKYGIGNRLWVGIGDMMAMRWYKRRHFSPDRLGD
jgi:glycosyltransferase involved in cell wall biosynthesis